MKPTTQHTRPKAWIPFTNFNVSNEQPTVIALKDCLFPYEGCEDNEGFIWGLYGTLSANQGMFLVDSFATKNGKSPLTVQGWYRVDNFDSVRSQIDEEIAESSGFLHLDRLKSSYRDQLRELVLLYAESKIKGWKKTINEGRTLHELVLSYPRLIQAIFDYNPNINLIVHPVYQRYDPTDRRTLSVATMRNIESRVMSVQVRYLEDQVKVTF